MAKPRLRMFAGPNGSGKSVLIEELKNSKIPLGPVVNADEIRKQRKNRGYLDLIQFRLKNIQQEDWEKALKEIAEIKNRLKKIPTIPEVHIKENTLICKDVDDAYHAALITDFLRHCLVQQNVSFSFETVMSHPAKIEFLARIYHQEIFRRKTPCYFDKYLNIGLTYYITIGYTTINKITVEYSG